MAGHSKIDCSTLTQRESFPGYIAKVRNATNGNFTLVEQCKTEVCNALWGSGNPDISGIGVSNAITITEGFMD